MTVISMLTGKRFSTIRRKILKIRGKFPRDYYGARCPKSKMSHSTEETFLSEIKRCAADYIKFGKFIPYEGKIKKFMEDHPKGTFLINFKRHVAIANEGLVCGNHGSCTAELFYFKHDNIESFCRLTRKKRLRVRSHRPKCIYNDESLFG